jgi:hypothetical protein
MSLTNCPGCNNEVSTQEAECPHCGFVFQNQAFNSAGVGEQEGVALQSGSGYPSENQNMMGWFYGYIISFFVELFGVFLIVSGLISENNALPGFGFFVMIAGVVGLVICYMTCIYKGWSSISAEFARTSPGKAVGFMFIPLFNFYWIFQSWYGWSQDFNKFVSSRGRGELAVPEGLYLAGAILTVLAAIPYLGSLIGLAAAIVNVIALYKLCRSVDAL